MNAPVRNGPARLAMRGVVKRFGGVQALRGVDFDLQPGEALRLYLFVHLRGHVGAGRAGAR